MPHHRRPTRLAGSFIAVLALAACSGDDANDAGDTTSAASASDATSTTTVTTTDTGESATTTPGDDTAEASDTSDTGDTATGDAADTTTATAPGGAATTAAPDEGPAPTVIVESLDDVPQACQDLLGDFLRLVEPTVEGVDWSSPSVGEFQQVSEELADEFEGLDTAEQAEGCDAFDFGNSDASLAAAVELAEREAPGTVAWLEFIGSLGDEPVADAALPTDCDGAIAYIDALIADDNSLADVPFSEVDDIAQVINTITVECDPDTATEFLERQEISDFLS